MKPTLSELWRGDIRPIEAITKDNENIKELRRDFERCCNVLWNQLDGDGKQVLTELQVCFSELSRIEKEESFTQGFSLAVKLMTEAISD